MIINIPSYIAWIIPAITMLLGFIWSANTKSHNSYDFSAPFIAVGKLLLSVIVSLIIVVILLLLKI